MLVLCERCLQLWPEDPKHQGFADSHMCCANDIPEGAYFVNQVGMVIEADGLFLICEVQGGPHDGKRLRLKL